MANNLNVVNVKNVVNVASFLNAAALGDSPGAAAFLKLHKIKFRRRLNSPVDSGLTGQFNLRLNLILMRLVTFPIYLRLNINF